MRLIIGGAHARVDVRLCGERFKLRARHALRLDDVRVAAQYCIDLVLGQRNEEQREHLRELVSVNDVVASVDAVEDIAYEGEVLLLKLAPHRGVDGLLRRAAPPARAGAFAARAVVRPFAALVVAPPPAALVAGALVVALTRAAALCALVAAAVAVAPRGSVLVEFRLDAVGGEHDGRAVLLRVRFDVSEERREAKLVARRNLCNRICGEAARGAAEDALGGVREARLGEGAPSVPALLESGAKAAHVTCHNAQRRLRDVRSIRALQLFAIEAEHGVARRVQIGVVLLLLLLFRLASRLGLLLLRLLSRWRDGKDAAEVPLRSVAGVVLNDASHRELRCGKRGRHDFAHCKARWCRGAVAQIDAHRAVPMELHYGGVYLLLRSARLLRAPFRGGGLDHHSEGVAFPQLRGEVLHAQHGHIFHRVLVPHLHGDDAAAFFPPNDRGDGPRPGIVNLREDSAPKLEAPKDALAVVVVVRIRIRV